jgi:hypothetical protein
MYSLETASSMDRTRIAPLWGPATAYKIAILKNTFGSRVSLPVSCRAESLS